TALALAPLSLVQSVAAGGIGILAFVSARMSGRHLGRTELPGVFISMLGLLALAISLAAGTGEGSGGETGEIVLWLGATAAAAVVALVVGRRFEARGVAYGIAGGLFFSIGDISVKVATQGGARTAFAVGGVVGSPLAPAVLVLRRGCLGLRSRDGVPPARLPEARGAHRRRDRHAADERPADRGRQRRAGRAGAVRAPARGAHP